MFSYISLRYLRLFLIIFFGLQAFFVGIDSLKHLDDFPNSANLVILFFSYEFLYAFNYTLPISLLLTSIVFYLGLIGSAQFSAFLALGYSKRRLFAPSLIISFLIILIYIGLNATPFVYAQERAEAIISKQNFNITQDLLVRYNGNYVYFGRVNPLLQIAQDIRVFELQKDRSLLRFTQANEAAFSQNHWILKDAKIAKLPLSTDLGSSGLQINEAKTLKILKGFRPKVLDSIYQNKPNVSILDAFQSLILLQNDSANSSKIRAILYSFILVPFFVPLSLIILMPFFPTLSRYKNFAVLGFMLIIFALVIWGIFFAFGKLAVRGLLNPELMLLLPLLALLVGAIYCYRLLDFRI